MLETITGNFILCFHSNEYKMKLPVILVVIALMQPAHLAVIRNVRTTVNSEYIGKYEVVSVCLSVYLFSVCRSVMIGTIGLMHHKNIQLKIFIFAQFITYRSVKSITSYSYLLG